MPSFDLATVTARLERSSGAAEHPDPSGARASVAAILRPDAADGDAELLFIVRAERAGDPWSGHVAFPGGKREQGDASLLATAHRETHEEIGLDLRARANLVGRLEDVPAIARSKRIDLTITPYVFALDRPEVELRPNAEVATTLWVPLGKLARFEGAGTFSYVYEGKAMELPCLRLGDHVLWGLTYRMVILLLEALKAE